MESSKPYLIQIGVRPEMFAPYIKAGRFTQNEPEELAKAYLRTPTWTVVGFLIGVVPPFIRHRYLAKKAFASGFPTLAPSILRTFVAVPVSAVLGAFVCFNVHGVIASREWSKLHPDYTPDEIVEKIKLFYAIRDYARDPNQIRPPIKAETGTSVSPPTKESERVANNAIAAEFRKESPFKTLK